MLIVSTMFPDSVQLVQCNNNCNHCSHIGTYDLQGCIAGTTRNCEARGFGPRGLQEGGGEIRGSKPDGGTKRESISGLKLS